MMRKFLAVLLALLTVSSCGVVAFAGNAAPAAVAAPDSEFGEMMRDMFHDLFVDSAFGELMRDMFNDISGDTFGESVRNFFASLSQLDLEDLLQFDSGVFAYIYGGIARVLDLLFSVIQTVFRLDVNGLDALYNWVAHLIFDVIG